MTSSNENEKSPALNVLTITRPSPSRQPSATHPMLTTIHDVDSTHSLSPTQTSRSEKEYIMEHSTELTSNPAADSKVNITATDRDLEMGLAATPMTTKSGSRAPLNRNKSSGVNPYPCRATQKRLRREQKLARAKCACWQNMSKTWRKIIIVVCTLIMIAIITLMAVLISKATGSGVYHGHTNTQIT